MPIPLGPILAQLIDFSVGDRSEVRLVTTPTRRLEGATLPAVAVRSSWKHLTLSAGYSASMTLVPLESQPRTRAMFNNVFLSGSYRFQRTTLSISQSLGFGSLNFATQALSDSGTNQTANSGVNLPPADGGAGVNAGGGAAAPAPLPIGTVIGPGGAPVNSGTPGTSVGGANQLRAVNTLVNFGTALTRVGVVQELSPVMRLGLEGSYTVAGGLREEDKTNYPAVQGTRLGALFGYRMNPRDDLTSTAVVQYSSNEYGDTSWLTLVGESWGHRFAPRTTGNVGVGVSYSRMPIGNGFSQNSIYPTFTVGFSTIKFVSRGTLALSAGAGAAPVLDPIAQVVDPRVALNAAAGYQKDRSFVGVAASSVVSVAGQGEAGALSAVGASCGVGYRFASALSADAGVRLAYQSYQGTNVIPLTYGVFVGVTVGAVTRLK